jgi:hypothetical protein
MRLIFQKKMRLSALDTPLSDLPAGPSEKLAIRLREFVTGSKRASVKGASGLSSFGCVIARS